MISNKRPTKSEQPEIEPFLSNRVEAPVKVMVNNETVMQINEDGNVFVKGNIYSLGDNRILMSTIDKNRLEDAGKVFGIVGIIIAILFGTLGFLFGTLFF
jgi:hypothetical protein